MSNSFTLPLSRSKLSASALSSFLKSPKSFYWRYIACLDPILQSISTFDHDKLLGILWSEAVDRFYKGVSEPNNTAVTLAAWQAQTEGWVPPKVKDRYTAALENWLTTYHQEFSPKDGVRNGSEKLVENERFVGYLDGLSHDGKIIHEVKSTSRSPQISEQLWKVQNSVQVKLYCVLTGAEGIRIEFAWKDTPYGIYRSDILRVTAEQREAWEQELNTLADMIYSLGDDEHNYPCHPDGCCIVSKGMVAMCSYQSLCSRTEGAEIAYKPKSRRQ